MTGGLDRRARYGDREEEFRVAFEGLQSAIWTALPGEIVSVDFAAMTCVVQPTTQIRQLYPDGTYKIVTMPTLLDCPIVFASAGGYTLTLPMKAGDEVLVVFASRCIDNWWQKGHAQPPAEMRMHDLSDGFALPGVFSQPNVISGVSTTTAQLRSNDGQTYVEVDGTGQMVNICAPSGVNMITPVVTVTGIIAVENQQNDTNPFSVNGKITTTGDVIAGFGNQNVSVLGHDHSGVMAGSDNTGPPVTGT